MVLDQEQEVWVLSVTTLFIEPINIHLDQEVQITALITYKALVTVPAKHLDFNNVFSKKSVVVLPEHTKINIHAINLEDGKRPFYEPLYSLRLVKLETLKI